MNNITILIVLIAVESFILTVQSDSNKDQIISAVKDNGCIPHIHIPKQNPKRKQKQMKDIYNYASLWGK